MDPDKCLQELLELSAKDPDELSNDDTYDLLLDIRERVMDLDEWITKGGFLPSRWVRK